MLSEQSCPLRMMLPHVVGRGVTWWGESSPKKARVTVQVKQGAHRAVTRNDKKSFPGFSAFPVEADRMSRRGSQTMKMVWQGLTRFRCSVLTGDETSLVVC